MAKEMVDTQQQEYIMAEQKARAQEDTIRKVHQKEANHAMDVCARGGKGGRRRESRTGGRGRRGEEGEGGGGEKGGSRRKGKREEGGEEGKGKKKEGIGGGGDQ